MIFVCSGCPVRQEIAAFSFATAQGDGLHHGVVDKPAEFLVDIRGEHGDLYTEVQGSYVNTNYTVWVSNLISGVETRNGRSINYRTHLRGFFILFGP